MRKNTRRNYILTRMQAAGLDFATALAEAQALGYAEADPSLDVDGTDAAHKLTLLAANAGVLCGQLLQMTSGEIYTKDDNGNHTGTARIHAAKIWALDDLIQQANGQPAIVFYYFQHERDRILEHFADSKEPIEARELRTADDIRDWNAGKIDVLLLHPASAGHGLNLQAGGHIAIWYTMPNWNLELYQQANARIYRQGQKQPVTIYRIIAEGTIDEDMEDALARKDVTQKALIAALRR